MLFRRKIYDKLLKWKSISEVSTSLLIKGAMRVGKLILQSFMRRENKKAKE